MIEINIHPIDQKIAYAAAKRYMQGGRLDVMTDDLKNEFSSLISFEEARGMILAIDAYEDSREPDGAHTANP